MAYTDTEVEEVRIVLTMYTDAHLAGKNGRHSKAKEPMYFLPHASFRSAKRAWARARGGGGWRAGGARRKRAEAEAETILHRAK
jgi:hypothetical protein